MATILKFFVFLILQILKIILYIFVIFITVLFYSFVKILKFIVLLLDKISTNMVLILKEKIIGENENIEEQKEDISENNISGIIGMIKRNISPTVENIKTTLQTSVSNARKLRKWLEKIEVIYSDKNNNNTAVISDIFLTLPEEKIREHFINNSKFF